MKVRHWIAVVASLVALAGPLGRTASASYYGDGYGRPVSVSYFRAELAPYGHWFMYGSYGWAWSPHGVSAGWRPYEDGYWVYSDCGWTWVSYEPWGWAPYHYGRWLFDAGYGWVWVPDTVWGPAWVAWRYDDDYIGWAPLPPSVGWTGVSITFTSGYSGYRYYQPRDWCFVERRVFLDRNVRNHVFAESRNPGLLRETQFVARYSSRDRRPVNLGLNVASVERSSGRRVPRYRLEDARSPRDSRVSGDALRVFRPGGRAEASRGGSLRERLGLDRGRAETPVDRRAAPERRTVERPQRTEWGAADRRAAREASPRQEWRRERSTEPAPSRPQWQEPRADRPSRPEWREPRAQGRPAPGAPEWRGREAGPQAAEYRAPRERPQRAAPSRPDRGSDQGRPDRGGGRDKEHGRGHGTD